MNYGVGADRLPVAGRTTDDLKIGNFEGFALQFGTQLSESVTATTLRSRERKNLRPNEVLVEERELERAKPVTKDRQLSVDFLESEEVFQKRIEGRDVGTTFSAQEATEYNTDIGKSYEASQSLAQLDWDRENHKNRVARNNELLRVQNGALPKGVAMLGGFAGAMADPANLALVFVPGVGQVKTAMNITKIGRLGFKTSDFLIGAAEGVLTDLALEVPNYVISNGLQEEYTLESLMFSTMASGTLSGVIQVPQGVWGRAIDAKRVTDNPTDIDKLIPGSGEVPDQLRKLARLEMEDSIEIQKIIDEAVGNGETILQRQGLSALAEHDHRGSSLGSVRQEFPQAPGVARKQFLNQAQHALDTDLYFLSRNFDLLAERSGDATEQVGIKKAVFKAEVAGEKLTKKAKAAQVREAKRKDVALDKLVKRVNRELEPITPEEIFAGFEDGGIQLQVRPPDELEFSPNANAAREIEVSADRAFETSMALDELGERVGIPEVKNLDRTKHLMKSFEMRLMASRMALGNMLEGKPVRVDFLMRKAVAMDMNNRGLTTDIEYRRMMESITSKEKDFHDEGSAGVFADPNTPVISDATVRAGDLDPEAEARTFAQREEEFNTETDIGIEEADFNFEELEIFQEQTRLLDELNETEKVFSGEKANEALNILARCMAGGKK